MKYLFLLILVTSLVKAADYTAKEYQNELQIKTPYGEKTVIGDYGLSNYRLEIPVDELLPEKLKEMKRRGENIDELKETLKETSTKESKETATHTIETKIIERELAGENPNGNGKVPPKVTIEYDDSDRLVLEANRLYNKRKYNETLSVLDELLRRKPDFVRGWIMKGSVLYVRGHKDLAQVAWKKAQVLQPENADIKSIMEMYK